MKMPLFIAYIQANYRLVPFSFIPADDWKIYLLALADGSEKRPEIGSEGLCIDTQNISPCFIRQ